MAADAHTPAPKPGTVTRERDGEPASLLRASDYPVRAECLTCGRVIRCRDLVLADWVHTTTDDE